MSAREGGAQEGVQEQGRGVAGRETWPGERGGGTVGGRVWEGRGEGEGGGGGGGGGGPGERARSSQAQVPGAHAPQGQEPRPGGPRGRALYPAVCSAGWLFMRK